MSAPTSPLGSRSGSKHAPERGSLLAIEHKHKIEAVDKGPDHRGHNQLPLVSSTGLAGPGARRRLRGPFQSQGELPAEYQRALSLVPTTVHQHNTIRFGDSLMLLNHQTEVLLQADISRTVSHVDTTRAVPQEYQVHPLTTGNILSPCARNSFSLGRSDRKDDGYMDSLNVHYDQPVWIIASSSLTDQLLYVHLSDEEGKDACPVLLPRASKHSRWRIVPLEEKKHNPHAPHLHGAPVHVNEKIALENIATGHVLMSDLRLVETGFGVECAVYAEVDPKLEAASANIGTWSFVNDTWADAVAEVEAFRTGGMNWNEDKGDDFKTKNFLPPPEDDPVLERPSGEQRDRIEAVISRLSNDPRTAFCRRVFPILRTKGLFGVRKFHQICVNADVGGSGILPARVFEGGLLAAGVRLRNHEFDDLVEVFKPRKHQSDDSDNEDEHWAHFGTDEVSYQDFFTFMGGIMPDQRLDVVKRSYRKLRTVAKGSDVHIEDIMAHWRPRSHPEVQAGRMLEKDAYEEFFANFACPGEDGGVSPKLFLAFYQDVSMVFEESTAFVQHMRLAWDL